MPAVFPIAKSLVFLPPNVVNSSSEPEEVAPFKALELAVHKRAAPCKAPFLMVADTCPMAGSIEGLHKHATS